MRGRQKWGPPSTQPQPLGPGLPRARIFFIFNLFKRVFKSLFNAFCSNSSHICLNYRYKFLIYTFSISCLENLGRDSLPPKITLGGDGLPFLPPSARLWARGLRPLEREFRNCLNVYSGHFLIMKYKMFHKIIV